MLTIMRLYSLLLLDYLLLSDYLCILPYPGWQQKYII